MKLAEPMYVLAFQLQLLRLFCYHNICFILNFVWLPAQTQTTAAQIDDTE